MYKHCTLAAICLIFAVSCTEPVLEFIDEEETNTPVTPLPFVGTVAYILENDIYMFNETTYKNPKRLTFTPSNTKNFVTISYGKSKIAYVQSDSLIVIDTAGAVVAKYKPGSGIDDISWVNNDQTIKVHRGTSVVDYGASYPVSIPYINPLYATFLRFCFGENGDHAYIWSASGSEFNTYNYYNPSKPDANDDFIGDDRTHKLWFSENASYMMVANAGFYDQGIEDVRLYNTNTFAATYIYYARVMMLNDIVLSPDLEYSIYSYTEELSDEWMLVYENVSTHEDKKLLRHLPGPITSIDCR